MFNRDFRDFFALLNAKGVEYLLVGGAAFNYHAPPRATKDIDVRVNREPDNVVRLLDAIRAFGFPTDSLDVQDLGSAARVLMLGRVPNRIDILTAPAGLDWDGSWARRRPANYDDVPISVLSLADLIASKKAAGRTRDLADVELLEKILRRHPTDP